MYVSLHNLCDDGSRQELARRLGTHDPVHTIGGLIDRSFELPLGDPRYARNHLTPGTLPL